MNEVWRVLKPDGIFLAHTPHYEHIEAFSDPTHVNFITRKTIDYFTIHAEPLGRIYGFTGTFELLNQYSHPQYNYWLVWELRAKK
jgi:SAM-dependent methyltransferase